MKSVSPSPWLMVLLCLAAVPCFAQKRDDTLQVQSSYWVSEGNEIRYHDVTISLRGLLMTADEVLSNEKTGIITARGNVKIDYTTSQGLVEITAHEVSYDRNNRSGLCQEVTAQFADDLYFVGASLEILNAGEKFIVLDGNITACNQAMPQWSVKMRKTVVQQEGYAFIHGAQFRVKNVPILYIPYFIAPAMQKRRSGLLTPDVGSAQRNGFFYGQPLYWAPRGDMDFTFTPYVYKDAGLRFDLDGRYLPSLSTRGNFEGSYFADDVMRDLTRAGQAPEEDGKPLATDRFRATWTHDQDTLGGHLRLDIEAGSDFSVDRDFLEEVNTTRLRDYYYRAGFDRNLGKHSLLTLKVDRRERILSTGQELQSISRLPDIRFYQPNEHLGRGFYLRNYAYATLFDVQDLGSLASLEIPAQREALTGNVMRLGLDSEISRTQNWVKFLHTRWGARYQGAYYQVNERNEEGIKGGAYAFLETVGPRLQKIYRAGDRRLVHYLDLGLTMKLGSEQDQDILDTILFDELDIGIDEQASGLRTAWRVSSRLFVGPVGKVRPLLDVEIRQEADFNIEDSQPIKTRFRLLNLKGVNAHGIFEYDPTEGALDTLSLYTGVNRGSWTGYGGYVKRWQQSESFIGLSQWNLARWRSSFKVAIDYDIEKDDIKSQEFAYSYQGQCVGLATKYVRSPFDSTKLAPVDYFQVTLNLRNLSDLGSKF